MKHSNYFEIVADSYYELGLKEGALFGQFLVNSMEKLKAQKSWKLLSAKSKLYLDPTEKAFPWLIEEIRGYASGAGVSFQDMWTRILKSELPDIDKCTTVITNNGRLVAHNEDWDANSRDAVCVLKKTVENLTIFELFYFNTLGGNTISINSHGFVQTINTLTHTDTRVGIPRNITSRFMSETNNPSVNFNKFKHLVRASGYSHNFVSSSGEAWNVESSALRQNFKKVNSPFIHTNHYLSKLRELENEDNSCGTYDRYEFANKNVKNDMSIHDLQTLMSDESNGPKVSIFNERTIARMLVDLENSSAYVWLLREHEKGWVKYNLEFLPAH